MIQFILNNQTVKTDLPAGTTLLDYIRYHRHLTGTKIGCREGDCGACTVLVGESREDNPRYRTMTSCLTPLANVQGKHVVTIEGINPERAEALTPVQEAMVAESATQCGFCTPGFIVSLTNHCLSGAGGSAIAAIDGNICRCTGYKSIERAAERLSALLQATNGQTPLEYAIEKGIVPAYFSGINSRLKALPRCVPPIPDGRLVVKTENDLPQQGLFPGMPGDGPTATQAVFLGGGTDLYVQRHEAMVHAPARPLFDQKAYREIRQVGDSIEIGGSATVTDLLESPLLNACFPALKKHLKLVSSTPIRNMASVAGNLVNASPIGDLSVWFLAMDATVVLASSQHREVPLRDFYLGYKTLEKTADEVLEKIRFRMPGDNAFFNFEKVSKRTHLDIASVNSAAYLEVADGLITEVRVATGGVAPVPFFLKRTSAFLTEKRMPANEAELLDLIFEADKVLQSEISPISDVRGSVEYKRILARQLLMAHFIELIIHHGGTEARRFAAP